MNLLKTLAKVSSFTLISRILGLVREVLIANLLGAGMMTDAFNVAFRLPNMLRRLFAEGAFSQAFVPILGEYKNRQDEASTRALVNHVCTLLGLTVFFVSALGVLGAPWVIQATASGFIAQPDKFQLAVELTRITFPYIFFQAMVALSAAVLNTWGKFSLPAFTPVMFNLTAIVMILFAAPYFDNPARVLAWSAFIGGVLQMVIQVPALWRIRMLPRFSLSLADPGVRRVLKTMAPATLGVSVAQVSLVINTTFASWLPTGSISWLNYADRLMEFPVGLLGAALGTILLPSLSKMKAKGDGEGFSATLDWGLRVALLLTAPAAIGMMLLAVPLAATLFQHGAFKSEDTLMTQQALIAYSVGLIGLILVKNPRPGVLLAPGRAHPAQIRADLAHCDPIDESGFRRLWPPRPCGAGALHRSGCHTERQPALLRPSQSGRLYAPCWLDGVQPEAAHRLAGDGRHALVCTRPRRRLAPSLTRLASPASVRSGRARRCRLFCNAVRTGLPRGGFQTTRLNTVKPQQKRRRGAVQTADEPPDFSGVLSFRACQKDVCGFQ
jgi:putative peptidoglycan lipid II flippase